MGQLAQIDLVRNPEPRVPCLLLLDVSHSMYGEPIHQLTQGVKTLEAELKQDAVARKRVEVGIVTFGGRAMMKHEFVSAEHFQTPDFEVNGATPLGEALDLGMDLLEARKKQYRENNINYYRPWVMVITDGLPTDEWQARADAFAKQEKAGHFTSFAIGVEGADPEVLRRVSRQREPLKLKGLSFGEFFLWLSNSVRSVSNSQPGETVKLDPPSGWGEVYA